ncbi:MAG: hypothetical protein KGZ83_09315 [Sulfuricella sp.]|nr:hypothetical protein [Sulfuricella sp.]
MTHRRDDAARRINLLHGRAVGKVPHRAVTASKVVLPEVHDPGSYEMVIQFPHRALMAPRVRVTIDCLLAAFL